MLNTGEWRTKKTRFHINRYGNASPYLYKTFTIKRNEKRSSITSQACLFPEATTEGKIVAVVVPTRSNRDYKQSTYYFKCYNTGIYRRPPVSDTEYFYIECTLLMTTDESRRPVLWTKELFRYSLVGRRVRRKFKEGWFSGEVTSFNCKTEFYLISYEDGDTEEADLDGLLPYLRP